MYKNALIVSSATPTFKQQEGRVHVGLNITIHRRIDDLPFHTRRALITPEPSSRHQNKTMTCNSVFTPSPEMSLPLIKQLAA